MYYFNIINDNGARTGTGSNKTFFCIPSGSTSRVAVLPFIQGDPKSRIRLIVRQGLFGSKISLIIVSINDFRISHARPVYRSRRLELPKYYRNCRLYTRRCVRNVCYDLFEIKFLLFGNRCKRRLWRPHVKNDEKVTKWNGRGGGLS